MLCALAPNVYALIVPRRWMTLFGLGLVFGAPVILRQIQMAAVLGVDFWLRDLIYSAAIKVSVLSRVVPVPSIEELDAIYRAAGVLRAPAAPTSSVAVILQTLVSLVTYALIPSIGLMTFGLAVVVGMLAIFAPLSFQNHRRSGAGSVGAHRREPAAFCDERLLHVRRA